MSSNVSPRIPKYRRHTTRDKAFVVLDKKRVYLPGAYNSPESRRAYEKAIQRLKVASVEVVPVTAENATLGHLSNAYLAYCAKRFGMDSRSSFHDIRRAVAWVVGSNGLNLHALPAGEFGPKRLKELQRFLTAEGLARNTINGIAGKVRTWFKWCVSEELVSAESWHALQSVAGLEQGQTEAPDLPPRSPAEWRDVQPVFRHLQPVTRDMLWLQWYTGARSRSICEAKPEQFELAGDLWLWRPRHKTERRKEVVLPIGPRCFAHVRQYVLGSGPYCFNPRSGRNGTNHRYRDAYDAGSYRQAISRAIKAAQEFAKAKKHKRLYVPQRWTPHQLRHARGTMVRDRFGVEAAAAVLGHANVNTTEIYTAKAIATACQVAREIG